MNQTWENEEKPNFGSDFVRLVHIWALKNFFRRVYVYY